MEINLKLILSVNPNGRWEVKWAGPITNDTGLPQEPIRAQKAVSKSGDKEKNVMGLENNIWVGPSHTKPTSTHSWRPKPRYKPITESLCYVTDKISVDPKPSLSFVKLQTSQEEDVGVFSMGASLGEALREGSSSFSVVPQESGVPTLSREAEDWIFQLRDGRSVRLPSEVMGSHMLRLESTLPSFSVGEPIKLHTNKFSLVMEEDGSVRPSTETLGMGKVTISSGSELVVFEEDDAETWENNSTGDDGLLVESQGLDFDKNQGQPGMELLGWDFEEAPLVVEPLAMVVEPSSPGNDPGLLDNIVMGNKPKSAWLIQNLKAFGEVLGASYIGFEDRVEKLLHDIEARRNNQPTDIQGAKKKTRKGQRLSRELKNLCSSFNYEGSSVSKRSVSRERALVSHQ